MCSHAAYDPSYIPVTLPYHVLHLFIPPVEGDHSPKSWLKTLEEMQLLAGDCGDSNLGPRANGFDIPSAERQKVPSTPGDNPLVHHPPSNSGKVIIKPAKFRYRRFSISSATAALSLNDNTREMCPTPNITHLHHQDTPASDSPANQSGGVVCNGPGLPRRQPRRGMCHKYSKLSVASQLASA